MLRESQALRRPCPEFDESLRLCAARTMNATTASRFLHPLREIHRQPQALCNPLMNFYDRLTL